ncbi:hypothetical protein [Colwellia sp. MB02u-6]|nr:hypothetical protein [Colwellia sp. MB02u-6]
MNNEHVGELVLSKQQIQEGVQIVAKQLSAQFHNAVVISVVPGESYLRLI